jgi:hypothetical protein
MATPRWLDDYFRAVRIRAANVLQPPRTDLDFEGAGVSVVDAGDRLRVVIPGAPSSSGHVIKDEGVTLTTRPNLNVIGPLATATDNSGTLSTDLTVTLPSGGDVGIASGVARVSQITLGSDAVGDTYYRSSSSAVARLPIGSAGQVLTVVGGVPAYASPSSPTTGGWSTLVDIDFTAMSNQNILAGGDGLRTVGGSFPIRLVATASMSSANVVSGSGVELVIGAGANIAMARALYWSDYAALTAYDSYAIGDDIEVSVQTANDAFTAVGEKYYASWLDRTAAAGRLGVGREYIGAAENSVIAYQDPGAAGISAANPSATAVADDVLRMRAMNSTYGELSTGVYSAGWPRATRLRGFRQHAVQNSAWIPFGSQQSVQMTYQTGATAHAGRKVTIKRIRIRVRPV